MLQPVYASAISFDLDSEAVISEQASSSGTDGTSSEGGSDIEGGTGSEGGSDIEGGSGSEDGSDIEGGTGSEGSGEQPGEEGKEEDTVPFSCHTVDPQGRTLNAYWSEEESAWYLFVPSTQRIADTVIYYTGTITEATAGQVDAANGIITGAFTASGDQVQLSASDETVHTVVVMQSKLPSVHITLNGTTLGQVHRDKNVKYKNNTVSIMDPSGKYDLLAEDCVEFKGRGNSTWAFFDKKAYQIKFDDKTSVLGMGKAKKWVLLANAADETLMRNMLCLNVADQIGMDFVTEFAFVDLWVNGEYLGNYMFGEKVELGENRVDLDDPYATLFEQDTSFYFEEDYWFYNDTMGKFFTAKETNADDSDPAEVQIAIDAFQRSLDKLMRYLYTTPSAEVKISELEKIIDVDSFAKYYLVNEYCGNAESTASSFYAHMNGLDDVIHLGPVWDYDCSMGNYKTEYEYYMSAHVLFNCLLASPEFYNRTVEIYNQYRMVFAKLSSNAAAIKEQIAESATMNYIRWNVWGEPNPKDSLKDYAASYEEGYDRLADFLYKRATSFSVQSVRIPVVHVDEDCVGMKIFFDNGEDDTSVVFAVWSDKGGQDDLKWYYPQKNADGLWEAPVDLSAHNTTGKYTIHVSTVKDGVRNRVAIGYAYIDKVNPIKASANLSEDQLSIEAAISGAGMYRDLAVHVWCKTDGDADLRKYALTEQEDFKKTCVIELKDHNETGEYCIQFYGKINDSWTLLEETTVMVTDKTWPNVKVEASAAQKKLTVDINNAARFSDFELLVWGQANGQNDAAVYAAVKNADGTWTAVIDLDQHEENGTYHIEISGTVNNTKKQITTEEIAVEGIVFPSEALNVYRLYNPNTQEHLLTANEEEMRLLKEMGWRFDGIAWRASKTGLPVYRLYNPYDDWHTYSISEEEIGILTELGWTVDGIVFTSTDAVNNLPVYRLFNPYEQINYHLLSSSEKERDMLLNLGWRLDGIALLAVSE